MNMSNILELAIIRLIQDNRFYAELIMHMKRFIDVDLPAVAGVNVTDSINLYINPYMWNALTVPEQVSVLIHECQHILHNHFPRWKELFPQAFEKDNEVSFQKMMENHIEFKLGNFAGDFAINEGLPNLPKIIKLFDRNGNPVLEPAEIDDGKGNKVKNPNAGKQVKGHTLKVADWKKEDPSVEHNKHMEYYYEKMKQDSQKNNNGQPNIGKGDATVDDHSLWAKGNQDDEFVKEIIKQTVNKSAEMAKGAGHNIPPDLEQLIQHLNYKAKDWRSDLRRFAAKATNIDRQSTRKKRNRRYGLLNPGSKFDEQLHLALAIDTSGSMFTELLTQIYAEINKIHKMGVKVTVIQADDKVHSIEEFDPKKVPVMHGRGGTGFFDTLKAGEELDIDGMIYFSDMDAFDLDKLIKPKYPIIWAHPENCKNTTGFGSETTITITKKSA